MGWRAGVMGGGAEWGEKCDSFLFFTIRVARYESIAEIHTAIKCVHL